ncbi:hypothetical protein AJ79_02742 [Helicocarpus griseus UAMH5409]|uniref:Uncharacterized protein n=1 Tax=Helicocarpus griseus UAMH5409 TaxID=1447875 RepID=A0A2B7Y0R8_9EURO|nr:hypothetical protein AJ79_02742 [Helicocarpus griseus UAMH5409]
MDQYFQAFITASIAYLGKRSSLEHAVAQSMPDEVTSQGTGLGEYDFLMLAAVAADDVELALTLLDGDWINYKSQVFGIGLYISAFMGHLVMVNFLMSRGNPQINSECGFFGGALHAASAGGNVGIIQALDRWGANINSPGWMSQSALSMATYALRVEVVPKLLELGVDVSMEDDYGRNMFHILFSVYDRNKAKAMSILSFLLDMRDRDISREMALFVESAEKEGGPNVRLPAKQFTALGYAVRQGHLEVVRLLVEKGPDMDPEKSPEKSPLAAAVAHYYLPMAEYLMDNMADSSRIKKKQYKSALKIAVERGAIHCAQMLLERRSEVIVDETSASLLQQFKARHSHGPGPHFMQLLDAIDANDMSKVQNMLAQGADAHTPRGTSETLPEKEAIIRSMHEKRLIDHPIFRNMLFSKDDASAPSSARGTPIERAAITRNMSIVRIFLDRGAQIRTRILQSSPGFLNRQFDFPMQIWYDFCWMSQGG